MKNISATNRNNEIETTKIIGKNMNGFTTIKKENKADNTKTDNKSNLHKFGFSQAGKNKGNLISLRNALYRIYNGYLNELAGKQNKQTDDINQQIEETKEKIIEVNKNINHIEKTEIPEQQRQAEEFKNEIEKTRIDSESGFIDSDFNWVKTILFTVFSLMLGISLILFYTSLIYNGLFKNIGATIAASSIEDSASLFNNLLDVKSLFTLNTGIFISYLFSSLFLTMGLLLHAKTNTANKLKKYGNRIAKAILLIIALGAEIVFAYKIEKNIDEIKSMTMPDYIAAQQWTDLLFSVDVLLVIILGFIAYIIWSFALEGSFREWNKRNPKKLAAVKISELEKKINRRKYRISEFKKQLSELQGKLNSLNNKLESLKKKLNLVFFQRTELEDRLEDFFGGWLGYINNHEDFKNNTEQHQQVFIEIKTKLLNNDTENLISNN